MLIESTPNVFVASNCGNCILILELRQVEFRVEFREIYHFYS